MVRVRGVTVRVTVRGKNPTPWHTTDGERAFGGLVEGEHLSDNPIISPHPHKEAGVEGRRSPNRFISRTLATVSATALGALSLVAIAAPPALADGPGAGAPWVVSLGDSAISGEAGRWAGNTNGSPNNIDALGPTAY